MTRDLKRERQLDEEQLTKLLLTVRPEPVINKMDSSYRIETVPDQTVIIHVLTNPEEQISYTYNLCKNGTLELYTSTGRKTNQYLPDPAADHSLRQNRPVYVVPHPFSFPHAEIMSEYHREYPESQSGYHPPHRWSLVRTWIRSQPKHLRPLLNGDHIITAINKAVASLLDAEVYSTARDHRSRVSITRYNNAVLNHDAIGPLGNTTPAVSAWAMDDSLIHRNQHTNPGEMVAQIRDRMQGIGLERSSWRNTSRIPGPAMNVISHARFPNYLAAIILNAAAANNISPSKGLMNHAANIAAVTARRSRFLKRPSGKDTPKNLFARQTLQKLIAVVLKSPETELDQADTTGIADYAAALINDDTPFTNTTLSGIKKASARWHRRIAQLNLENEIRQRLASYGGWVPTWNSLLPQHEADTPQGKYTVHPLTDTVSLLSEGRFQRHCVGAYDRHCLTGRTRIFSIRTGDDIVATTEIQLQNGRWKNAQTRGIQNKRCPAHINDLASRIARQYQKEYDRTEPGDRHTLQLKDPETGEIRPFNGTP